MANNLATTISNNRMTLLILWFGFFFFNLAVPFYLYLSKNIELIDLLPALKVISTTYAPYVGVITMFYWGGEKDSGSKNTGTPFYLAIGCSLIWNGLIAFFLFPLILLQGNLEDSLEGVESITSMLSWLVAGAIGYYFAKTSET